MEALQVLGVLAAILLVSCGVSWWRAGRRPVGPDHRTRDQRIDRAQAEERAGPWREPTGGSGGLGGSF